MNPSGAPSVIERFTSLVGFCVGLKSLSNTREAEAKAPLKKVASNPDLTMTEQEKTIGATGDSLWTAVLGRGWFLCTVVSPSIQK